MLPKPVIGILTWRQGQRFGEPDYLRKLVLAGQKLGAEIYLFSHQDVNVKEKKIKGFLPKAGGGWSSRWFSWPQVVIDRYRRRVPEYIRLRNSDLLFFANSPFSKKWRVTQLLAKDRRVMHWIPETHLYEKKRVATMLSKYPLVYVKPGNGSGGKSILRISTKGKEFSLSGRDKQYQTHTAKLDSVSAVENWVGRWVVEQQIADGNFLVQQGIDLGLIPNHVADVRVLIQKDQAGEWRVTGSGVRIGEAGSSTSNLHGGGRAVSFEGLIEQRFGKRQAQLITKECHSLAHEVAKTLEDYFGRMMEFGLDIGVAVDGSVWLIEVNPKPGREVFRQMGDMVTYAKAIERPVQFALHLARKRQIGDAGQREQRVRV
ncbi:YheC/YheD family protein [Brevibacillus parabrevis]|uniref:YheC/YheD family endospore coat-associated protein n=1 Tax=Brevibacillus parabrevis TaxID=54914 RepID=UPI0028D49AEA|nr:YheC/YheD family protein [Brevibacillus parabrevis]MED1723655.1 YheC/YheD family protein [Brevibacillus parabrevis]